MEGFSEACKLWCSRTHTRRVSSIASKRIRLNMLTLHRGGVRGIVELEILRQLEKELGDLISIQSFFDLIVGTSTGGIVALGLTARNWSVDQSNVSIRYIV